jgi:hypothetical protein
MRTTADLIQELDEEAAKFFACAIAVGFESTTTFVFSHEENRIERLNDAVAHGGEPVGLIGVVKGEGKVTLCRKPLQEYAGEGWVGDYLDKLLQNVATLLGETTFETGSWVN